MTATRTLQAVRRRVRVRTRLRRARDAWRRRFPARLRRWPERAADPVAPGSPVTGLVDGRVTVTPAGAAVPTGTPAGRAPAGRLRTDPTGRWEVTIGPGRTVVAGRVGQPLDNRQLDVLSRLAGVRCDPARDDPPAGWAQAVVQLAVTGTVLWSDRPPAGPHAPRPADPLSPDPRPAGPWSALAPELTDLLATPPPGRAADPMLWELRGVQQRRVAMRHHLTGPTPPAVSALLVTKRPEWIPDAVAMLAAQTYPDLEIVVGVHGAPPPDAADLPTGDRPVRIVPVPVANSLGEALQTASRAASGALLTKVDDDDRYGQDHIWDLVLAARYSGATVVGKGAAFVHLVPKDLTVRRRMMAEGYTDVVAGGTIALTREALAGAGGWPPVPRSVDRALLDRVLAAGGTVYRTHPFGFIYTRHGQGHTWDPGLEYFLRDPLRTWPGLPPYAEFGTGPGGAGDPAGVGDGVNGVGGARAGGGVDSDDDPAGRVGRA